MGWGGCGGLGIIQVFILGRGRGVAVGSWALGIILLGFGSVDGVGVVGLGASN